jgi:hypothetical protein
VLAAFQRWPSLAETRKGLILFLKTLLHLMAFNPNFTYTTHKASENVAVFKYLFGIDNNKSKFDS